MARDPFCLLRVIVVIITQITLEVSAKPLLATPIGGLPPAMAAPSAQSSDVNYYSSSDPPPSANAASSSSQNGDIWEIILKVGLGLGIPSVLIGLVLLVHFTLGRKGRLPFCCCWKRRYTERKEKEEEEKARMEREQERKIQEDLHKEKMSGWQRATDIANAGTNLVIANNNLFVAQEFGACKMPNGDVIFRKDPTNGNFRSTSAPHIPPSLPPSDGGYGAQPWHALEDAPHNPQGVNPKGKAPASLSSDYDGIVANAREEIWQGNSATLVSPSRFQ
ncbi:MAG: hypothetical protein ABW189_00855 [Rickettsiales bacterium]